MEKNREQKPKTPAATRKEQPPELKLPFTKKKRDMGEEVYDRRVPILVSAIIYVALGILFFTSGIVVKKRDTSSDVMIDLRNMEELMRQYEEAKSLNELLTQNIGQGGEVRNIVSGDHARERDPQEYRQPTSRTEEFLREAEEVDDKLRRTREEYEQQLLTDEQRMREARTETRREDTRTQAIKVEGEVTVYYTLKDPPRDARDLFVPAYQCRTGGRVIVEIVVDRRGEVIAAAIAKGFSDTDRCMTETALAAAYKSRFEPSPDAPAKHSGRIIYTFVPQGK